MPKSKAALPEFALVRLLSSELTPRSLRLCGDRSLDSYFNRRDAENAEV